MHQWKDSTELLSARTSGMVHVTLPARVYSDAQLNLADLRLLSNGTTVPYALETAPPSVEIAYECTLAAPAKVDGRSIYDLPMLSGVPIDRLLLSSSTPDYERDAQLESWHDGKWTAIARITLVRTATRHVTTMTFPEFQARRVRLIVFNGDDRPLDALHVTAYGHPRRIVFDSVAGSDYRLYYGNPSVAAPVYDYGRTHDISWSAGQQAKRTALPQTWFMWAALSIASLCVAVLAVRALAR